MRTAELKNALLDYWSAKANGLVPCLRNYLGRDICLVGNETKTRYSPSTDWSQGGPLVERSKMDFNYMGGGEYEAHTHPAYIFRGKSMLEAAMRCFVATKFGEEVFSV